MYEMCYSVLLGSVLLGSVLQVSIVRGYCVTWVDISPSLLLQYLALSQV